MPRIEGFPPISTPEARILILGSMPGERSLQLNEYYAHKGNVFWKIMGALVGAGAEKPYDERVRILGENGIAVWDVIGSCVRQGSLDSAIEDESVNNFAAFFESHPRLVRIGLNGRKAAKCFDKYVSQPLKANFGVVTLPSTSPANARLSFEQKKEAWRALLAL